MNAPEPIYFASAGEFREWLADNHATASEVQVGFYKRHTKRPSPTWSESVDEALCYGWIDGIGRRVDEDRYTIRFTPRRPSSIWSAINIAKVASLEAAGRMTDTGRAAFAARRADRSGVYSYERPPQLPEEYRRVLEANPAAVAHFDACPPSYRRGAIWWVASAKREDTRQRRIESLVEHHARGERIPPLSRPKAR